jgi:predicted aspartyl protease
MLTGKVNRLGEPVVAIELILHARPIRFPAVVDTGFNGYLSVPRNLLARSKWRPIGTEKFEIATGSLVEQEIYLGESVFDGRRGLIYSVSTEARDILIGTKMLRGKVLLVNFRTKQVTIR